METNIDTKLKLTTEDRGRISGIVTQIQDISPSDATVFVKLEKIDENFMGHLKIRSLDLYVDISEETIDIDSLIDILNIECREKIDE